MEFDQLEVKQEEIKVLTVKIVKANDISYKGWWNKLTNYFDQPDSYVLMRVQTSPNSRQRTSMKLNNYSPVWDENFTFYLNHDKKNTLELTIMDADYISDDTIATQKVELDGLVVDNEVTKIVNFGQKTTLEIKLLVKYDKTKELRFSYELCDEEKDYVRVRKEEILKQLPKIFDEKQAPQNIDEIPTIAILGSGGGCRAACGLAGVLTALQEAGIFDCSSYITGLSGSSWYISTLYQHEGWPGNISCQHMADKLKKKLDSHTLSHFRPNFLRRMKEKERKGQLVSLTDLFGLYVGECLLDNQESKLSNQGPKVKYGEVPLPITTAVRARLEIPAPEFSEWVEFTPFEYGMAKYGVFGKTKEFGGKFYKGRLVRGFEESPLHYLQGIWGSAYTIILNRVINKKKDMSEQEVEDELDKIVKEEVGRMKSEDDESDDEDEEDGLPEDEIKNESWLLEALNPINLISSRKGKAALVFNILRGLLFKSEKDSEYDEAPGNHKTMCLVDSGLAFNLPFPTVLRPERKVELILSFDFSAKDGGDKELPFKNLLRAERWAKQHGLPFPQIEGNPILEESEIEECYVFEDMTNPRCPTILHFPLVNKTFRDFSKPGVPRVTQEEKDFGNFDIFDDPENPYSSFNFEYTNRNFDRLQELMKYNTLNNLSVIKEKIVRQAEFRRNNPEYARQ